MSLIHAFSVHFPFAVLVIGFIFDCLALAIPKDKNFSKMGYYLQCIGMFTVIVAWGTGHFFTDNLGGEAEASRLVHQQYAMAALVTVVFATLFRMVVVYLKKENTRLKYLVIALLLVAVIFVFSAGYTGINLVYNFLIG